MCKNFRSWLIGLALAGIGGSAQAQWATQTIALQPGWNSVFFEVSPQPSDCDSLFTNLNVESVWGWNRQYSPVQFIQSASSLIPPQPDWLFYVRGSNVLAGERSLFNVEGGKCYLIKLANNAKSTNWVVQGQPTLRKVAWVPNSYNFVGFSLDRTNPPTFQSFFNGSPAQASSPVYRLNSDGTWGQVANTATTAMRSGESFWIQCTGASTFQGPISVNVVQRSGLVYGRTLAEQSITIQNLSVSSKNLVFTLLPSGTPPTGLTPLAGAVPLSYWMLNQAGNTGGWVPINSPVIQTNLAAGKTWQFRLEVRRKDMNAYSGSNGLYQSLLEIRDQAGSSRMVIPVTAQGLATAAQATGHVARGLSGSSPLYSGLWVGSASINSVSQPASSNPTLPTNTAAPFNFRLIVHVDGNGQPRLMQKVLELWQSGTYQPASNNPSLNVVQQPGQFVLVTDESLIPGLTNIIGAAMRDGQPVGRRFSTAAFGFRTPIPMSGTGTFGAVSSVYGCQVVLDYNDPLNPFKHLYHPDHDNLDARFQNTLAEGVESFTVTRQIQLQFTATDPNNLALAGWGDSQLGGIYSETITGLHNQPLYIQGTFHLSQASTVSQLIGVQ